MGTETHGNGTGARAPGWGEGGTYNVAFGCGNGCLYCYRRAEMLRFKHLASGADWTKERVKDKQILKPEGGKGQVMLPSGHDITEITQEAVADLARRLLEARTPVGMPETTLLLVTKAWGPSVQHVCERLELLCPRPAEGRRPRVVWRLSIGGKDERLRAFWEPHASSFAHRAEVLEWLHKNGWQTSVSCEPLLEPPAAVDLVGGLAPWVSDTIWVGKCNALGERTAWAREAMGKKLADCVAWLATRQTPDWIEGVAYCLARGLPAEAWAKVRFKESYSDVLAERGWVMQNGQPDPARNFDHS